jgi:hypothetical protein
LLLSTWTYSTVAASTRFTIGRLLMTSTTVTAKRFARGGWIATHYSDIQYCDGFNAVRKVDV